MALIVLAASIGVFAPQTLSVTVLPTTFGPAVVYAAEIGCAGCKIADAAPYFSEAMNAWNRDDNFNGRNPIARPRGLSIHRVSGTLITYRLPNEHALRVRGGAFYDPKHDAPFEEVLLKLPPSDERVAGFLLQHFVEHRLELIID